MGTKFFSLPTFCRSLNKQLPVSTSWHPEPGCYAVDGFSILWKPFKCYAFPPFCQIRRVLEKMEREHVDQFLLIAPVWPMQSWYPLLMRTSYRTPILLPQDPQLLHLAHSNQLHHLQERLQLAAWILSANSSRQVDFSTQAAELICASWTKGTEKQYKPVWKTWSSWCDQRHINSLQGNAVHLLSFLAEQFHKGKSYSTLRKKKVCNIHYFPLD